MHATAEWLPEATGGRWPTAATAVFTIPIHPRTKKTSNQLVQAGSRQKILPSTSYRRWYEEASTYAAMIKHQLASKGLVLPLTSKIWIYALFFRATNTAGDIAGYEQALADWLQTPNHYRSEGVGIIRDDRQIVSWDWSRLLVDPDHPRTEVEIRILSGGEKSW